MAFILGYRLTKYPLKTNKFIVNVITNKTHLQSCVPFSLFDRDSHM